MNCLWIIYYDDETSFSSEDGGPEDAPREGVQVVVCKGTKTGKLPWHSEEFYCWQEDTWVPHDQRGVWKYLATEKWPIVLQTYAISPARFGKIFQDAAEDKRIPWVPKKEPRF